MLSLREMEGLMVGKRVKGGKRGQWLRDRLDVNSGFTTAEHDLFLYLVSLLIMFIKLCQTRGSVG